MLVAASPSDVVIVGSESLQATSVSTVRTDSNLYRYVMKKRESRNWSGMGLSGYCVYFEPASIIGVWR